MSNPYHFLSSVYSYELVGPGLGRFCAMVLPPLQLVLAVCFVVRRFVGGAFLVSSMLLAIFTVAQVSVLARGLEIGCGCFGAAVRSPVGGESLTLVGFLLFCSLSGLACWVAGQRSTQPEGRTEASA
jgi:Methylamine utilisation protein MauE